MDGICPDRNPCCLYPSLAAPEKRREQSGAGNIWHMDHAAVSGSVCFPESGLTGDRIPQDQQGWKDLKMSQGRMAAGC